MASGDNEADCDTSDTSPHLTSLILLLVLRPRRMSRFTKSEQVPAYREMLKAPLETPAGELEKKTSAGEGGRRRRTTHVGERSNRPRTPASICYFRLSRDGTLKPSARWVLRGWEVGGERGRVSES